jgi:hypothetical protein
MLCNEIDSFRIKTPMMVVPIIPIPVQIAYATFSGILFIDIPKRYILNIRKRIVRIVGKGLEKPFDNFAS